MVKTISARKTIITLIQESRDEAIQGTAFRQESWLSTIRFSDVMDIVLFYISLQPDLNQIGKITSNDFSRLVEKIWKEWIAEKKNEISLDLYGAFSPGSGPMDGSAGPAEMYMMYHPGICHYKYLLVFFSYPKELPSGWLPYREHMKIMVFPKWRREQNFKNLSKVFNLATRVCAAMREKTNTER